METNANKKKIIYSMRVAEALAAKGFVPTSTIPNLKDNRYVSWIYDWTEEFDEAMSEILTSIKEE